MLFGSEKQEEATNSFLTVEQILCVVGVDGIYGYGIDGIFISFGTASALRFEAPIS